jgi:thymidylate kinase
MKRIVVEGMDSTGKSTLIRTLKDQFHFLEIVVNEKGPEQDFNFWWPSMLFDSMTEPPYVPIHDRFFYSELVYGEVLRGYVNADADVAKRTRDHLRRESMLIYCRPDVQSIEETLANKEQMSGVASNFHKLLRKYDELIHEESMWYGLRYASYNWTGEDPRLVIARVERYLLG